MPLRMPGMRMQLHDTERCLYNISLHVCTMVVFLFEIYFEGHGYRINRMDHMDHYTNKKNIAQKDRENIVWNISLAEKTGSGLDNNGTFIQIDSTCMSLIFKLLNNRHKYGRSL